MLPAAPGPPPSSDSVLPFQGHGWASHCLLDTTPGCPPSTHTTVLTPRGSGSVSSSRYPTPSGREHVFPGSRGSAGQRPRGPGGEPRGAGGSHWQAPGTVCSEGPGPHRGPFTRGPWASHNNSPSFGSHGRHGLISLDRRRELTRLRPPWPPAPRTGRRTGGTHSRHSPAWTSPSLLTVSCQRGAWHRGERGDVVN